MALTFYGCACEDVELSPPSFSKKRRNNQKDVNDELRKTPTRKIYHPKVVSENPKKIKKHHLESGSIPKLETPKQHSESYFKKIPKCQRQLFIDDGDFGSLPFLEKFNDSKVEQGAFENSTITNEFDVEYNSLQSLVKPLPYVEMGNKPKSSTSGQKARKDK